MEMESTRRSFDRSREQIKKPRLSADDQPNPSGRAFAPRPAPTAASAALFREIEGGYQPQALGQAQQQYQELVSQYKLAIGELTFNSKPIITNLTIIAGENLHAAKAIAATVCNNIIEVPSDQKLPSLYLLDSIVKNIGKDYIKHFAARLPEVFCKAYRQVDAPVHQSMRHLFGTWKGVFPLQCLQMIERELGFSAAVNGSSSGGVASRLDSQSQRAHSIHVNPKYLERQRIQQSTRGKGTGSDTNVSTANSVEDVERPDRVVSVGPGRSWVDPLVKMQSIQRPQRGVLNEPVHGKKKVGASHGDFEYGSDVSRSTGRTSGMVTEQGLDKSWYGAGGRDPETLSTQRNGFNMKHGLPDYLAPEPANLPPTHSNARSGSGMSPSWKNSEEEEFMWETHSRLPDQDAANLSSNLRKDPWTPDDSHKMEFSLAEVGPRFDRETSFDSLSTEQKEYSTLGRRLSSPWKLQELHPTDGRHLSSEDYLATIGGLATSASSSARFAVRGCTSPNVSSEPTGTSVQQKFSSAGIVSPSGQSPMHQHPPSPSSSIPSLFPHPKLQNSAEQEFAKTHSLSQPAYKASRYLESLLPSTVLSGNLPKFQPENLQAASSIMPTFQPGHLYPSRLPDSKEIEPARQTANPRLPLLSRTPQSGPAASGNSDPIIAEPPEQSSTSSLLASVMKTGILSNIVSSGLPNPSFQDVGPLSSQLSTQTSRPCMPSTSQFPSSGSMALSASLSDSPSLDNSSATNVSQRKQERPGLPAGSPSSEQNKGALSKGLNPLSNLLSSLVAKGLISASKSETSSVLPPQIPNQKKNQSPIITNSSSTPPSSKSEKSSPLPPQNQSKKQSPIITNSSSTPPSSKSEKSSPLPPQNPNKSKAQIPSITKTKSTQASPVVSSEIPHKSTSDGISPPEPRDKSSQPLSVEIHNLIGLEFKPDVIREFHPPVISALCDDIPHQCSICGLRLKLREQLNRHMEWHTWKNSELEGVDKVTRRWYADSTDWIAGREGLPLELESSSSVDEIGRAMDVDEPVVPADEDQCVCVLCGQLFEDHYCQRTNKWLFKGAIRLGLTSGIGNVEAINEDVKGPIAHVNCVSDGSLRDLGLASGEENTYGFKVRMRPRSRLAGRS